MPTNPFPMPHVYQTAQWIAAPLERVFRFFADPRNLGVISPPSSGARLKSVMLTPPTLPGVPGTEHMAGVGSEIILSFRLLPYFPMRGSWTARIIEFDWLHRFRDLQVRGPFESFNHTHSFRAETRNGTSGTVIEDQVEYEVGAAALGVIANALFVRLLLRQMFTYRHVATSRELES
jgi:ligand-binding SRPBCC domain-containing protein